MNEIASQCFKFEQYEQAISWYFQALETEWVEKGIHNSIACAGLKLLQIHKPSIYEFNNNIHNLYLQIDQDAALTKRKLNRVNKIWHNLTPYPKILDQQIRAQGCIWKHFFSSSEAQELWKLSVSLYHDAYNTIREQINKTYVGRQRFEALLLMNTSKYQKSIKGTAKVGGRLGDDNVYYVRNIHKAYTEFSKYTQTTSELNAVSKFLDNCVPDEIIHVKSDIVFNDWRYYKSSHLHSTFDENYKGCSSVRMVTVMSHGVTLDIWEGAMLITGPENIRKNAAQEFRKQTLPSLSVKIKFGSTILIHPHAEFSPTHKDGSLDKITLLINEYIPGKVKHDEYKIIPKLQQKVSKSLN